eukprot:2886588-Alexandrium_andersonii.AAC.1
MHLHEHLPLAELKEANSTTNRVAVFGRLNCFFDAAIVIITTTALSSYSGAQASYREVLVAVFAPSANN